MLINATNTNVEWADPTGEEAVWLATYTTPKVGGDIMGYKIMVVAGTKLSPIEGTYETLTEACDMCHRMIHANEEYGSGYDPARWEFQIKELETGNMYPYYEN